MIFEYYDKKIVIRSEPDKTLCSLQELFIKSLFITVNPCVQEISNIRILNHYLECTAAMVTIKSFCRLI